MKTQAISRDYYSISIGGDHKSRSSTAMSVTQEGVRQSFNPQQSHGGGFDQIEGSGDTTEASLLSHRALQNNDAPRNDSEEHCHLQVQNISPKLTKMCCIERFAIFNLAYIPKNALFQGLMERRCTIGQMSSESPNPNFNMKSDLRNLDTGKMFQSL